MCFCLEESIYFHGGILKISYKYYLAFTYDVQRNDNSSLTEIGEKITQVSCETFQTWTRSYGIELEKINRGSGDFSIYENILCYWSKNVLA